MLNWLRKRGRDEADASESGPLREFVYLDEVSVYSLVASRVGPLPEEFTATESSGSRDELSSSVQASAGILKSSLASRGEETAATGSQVVSRSNVQATFKDLVEREQENFVIQASATAEGTPPLVTTTGLQALLATGEDPPWVLDATSLKRGDLAEVEVELEAEPSFRASATISSLMEMVQKTPELLGDLHGEDVRQAIATSRVLDLLHGGLVPLRGRLVHYRAVVSGQTEWLVHEAILSQLPADTALAIRPVYLVGVAEAELFWKDIRRVAFSHSRYFVMGRIGRDGVQARWTPMKLVEVLQDFLPEVAGELDAGSRVFISAMASQEAAQPGQDVRAALMRAALIQYAAAFATYHGHTCTEEDLARADLPTADQSLAYNSIERRRDAFRAITEFVAQKYGIPRDSLAEAQLRSAAMIDAGLGLDGNNLVIGAPDEQVPTPSAPEERYVDAEFVAIYW